MDQDRRSTVDLSQSPPVVTVPRRYNAAVDLLDGRVADGLGDKVAVVDDAGSTTYGALVHRTRQVAALLRRLGVEEEQRVLLCLLDTRDFPAVFFGAMRAGVVPVPVNTLLAPLDYEHLLVDSGARVLFVSDALWSKLAPAVDALHRPPKVVVVRSPLGGEAGGQPMLDALLGDATEDVADTTADTVAFWLYSSGSTGRPKGAVHLHSHLIQTAALYGSAVAGIRREDVVFSAAKLFFAYGLGNAMTFPFAVGATAALMAERPTPASVVKRLPQATVFCGVPTLFASLLASPEARDLALPRLRVSLSAGEPLPKHVGEQWKARLGTDILDGIGSTEMLHIFLSNQPGDVRYGTTGVPVPGYRLRLLDEVGQPVGPDEEGSLWVSGPTSAVAYWNQRERSLATFQGPWTHTGDRYVRSADGRYTYCGRADDMLKVGGIWVSPFEVESALAEHDAVLEAAVVGRADADGLIKPAAYVVLKVADRATAELRAELQGFVKGRLAPYKYPRWIEFVTELPKTATGKVQRFRLRQASGG